MLPGGETRFKCFIQTESTHIALRAMFGPKNHFFGKLSKFLTKQGTGGGRENSIHVYMTLK